MNGGNWNTVTLIRKKRDGVALSSDEIEFLINEYTADRIPDYQMSALLMAAFINGLDDGETDALTDAMLNSGRVLDLSGIPGNKVDKHSTGGVGDKLSLILAPIAASAGVPVPMISGRGLGHTGGTLDKLESIPGFRTGLSLKEFQHILSRHNLVLGGQTEEIAPADKRIYALRDVTATVESIPLISASIMSKKLAEGIDGLVLDVKFGSGAFMQEQERAIKLAETLVGIGRRFGKRTVAWLTDMNQPLGYAVGNWLEVYESIMTLRGEGPEDVERLSCLLAGTMIWIGKRAGSLEEGVERAYEQLRNGEAFDKWLDLVGEQGGDRSVIEDPSLYPEASCKSTLEAPRSGYLTSIDSWKIGMASLELGAGRKTKDDVVDPKAGILLRKKIGEQVQKGETIATLFTNNRQSLKIAEEMVTGAIGIMDSKKQPGRLITHRVDDDGIHRWEKTTL